jgi:hypothetical protein
MSQNFEDFDGEWIENDDVEQAREADSSALTWDEETVRETHREIELRSSRATGTRLF